MKTKASVSRETIEQKQLKPVGRALRNARHDQQLKLQDVEERSGVSSLTISKLEKGKLENSSLQTLNKIASALGLKITLSINGE